MKPLCMHQMVSNLQGNHSGQQSQVAQSETLVDQLEQSRPCSELVLEGESGPEFAAIEGAACVACWNCMLMLRSMTISAEFAYFTPTTNQQTTS